MDDLIKEFLVECYENLDNIKVDFVELEKTPRKEVLDRIFRAIHSIKGTCGFLGFSKLESLTHASENLLTLLRDGIIEVDSTVTETLLAVVDAVRQILGSIEETGHEGELDYIELNKTLSMFQEQQLEDLSTTTLRQVDAKNQAGSLKFGEILVEEGTISKSELDRALAQQQKGDPRRLGEILVDLGAISPDKVLSTLQAQTETRASVFDRMVRVDVELLDNLMYLVGDLVLTRNKIVQHARAYESPSYLNTILQLNVIITELQKGVMKMRMQPVGNIWNQLPRLVRNLASSCNKQARLDLQGTETELDRTIIEAIRDPLTHILRNSIDHGIETPEIRSVRGKPIEGVVVVRAFREGGWVNIEIEDDGSGIDPITIRERAVQCGLITAEKAELLGEQDSVNLIFAPGFSTADTVTNMSGRGVGMDVVKTNIERINGSVEVISRPRKGTTIKLKIPVTLPVVPTLLLSRKCKNLQPQKKI